MNIIMCIDDGEGIMFNHRRQSQDRVLRGRVAEMSRGARLLMSPYTARQFQRDHLENQVVSEDFLGQARDGDYCFVEDADPRPYEDAVESIIIYRWNRDYPRDTQLPLDLARWHLVRSADFEGSSHENITEEVYTRGEAEESEDADRDALAQDTRPVDDSIDSSHDADDAPDAESALELEEAAARCMHDET